MNKITEKIILAFISMAMLLDMASVSATELPENFTPVGPMGGGGAFTAVANDENALWTNPAGMARTRKARSRDIFHLTKFPNIVAGANSESRSFYSAVKSGSDANASSIVDNSSDLGDKPFWSRVSVFPVTIFEMGKNRPSAIGLFVNNRSSAVISQDDPERASVESISDVGVLLGMSFSNPSNSFSAGITVRPTYRYAFEDKVETSMLVDRKDFTNLLKTQSNLSTGVGLDAGFIYTYPDFWYPTIGAAVLNLPTGCHDNYLNPFSETRETVCGTTYTGSFSNTEAMSIVDPMDTRLGLSIAPRIAKDMALRLSMDMHHIYLTDGTRSYGLSEIETLKTLHGGVELLFGNPVTLSPFSLRAGINQGFVTAGFSLRLPFFSFEFASYGQDISSTKKSREDRRMVGSLSFDF